MNIDRKHRLSLLLVLYTASGACGLAYEVVWSRWLSLVLGNTTLGHSLVIGMFMGGLGLGYFFGGRRARKIDRPLYAYGFLELGIGVWGLLSPFAFTWLVDSGASSPVEPGMYSVRAMVLTSAVALLIPTFLMGATFPVMLEGLRRQGLADRRPVALLYGCNSAGAAMGALLAGFLLLEWVGLAITCRASAAVNIIVGVLMFIPWWDLGDAPRQSREQSPVRGRRSQAQGALLAAGVLGVVAMGVQAIWIRLFAVTLGSSVFALSTVLAVFIVGIGLGSLSLTSKRFGRGLELHLVLGLLSLGLVLSGAVVDWLPFLFNKVRLTCKAAGFSFEVFLWVRFFLVTLILLPITALFGAALPLATGDGEQTTNVQIRAFWVNTIGCVAGAAVTLPWVVPALGLESTYRLSILLITGVAILEVYRRRNTLSTRGKSWTSGLLAAAILGTVFVSFDPYLLSAGGFRSKSMPETFARYEKRLKSNDLVFYEDGKDASVAVLERNGHRVLKVNGKPDASTRGDMLTQVFSGHLPMLLHEDPTRTLVVGLGSGVTAHAASLYDGQVDVVELSGAVVRAAAYFKMVHHGVLDRSNVRVFETDARGFLRGLEGIYDVIISEPSNPWMAGNAGLFSVEFFRNVQQALKPSGILAQWFHTYEMDDETLSLVFNSIRKVFSHVTVWEMFPNDLLLVASDAPFRVNWMALEERVNKKGIIEHLREGGMAGLVDLLSRQALTVGGVRTLPLAGSMVNTDDLPLLEYAAPRSLYRKGKATVLSFSSERTQTPGEGKLMLDAFVREHRPLTQDEVEALFVMHTIYPGAKGEFRARLLPTLVGNSSLSFLKDVLFTLIRENELGFSGQLMARIYELGRDDPGALFVLSEAVTRMSETGESLDWAEESVQSMLSRCILMGDEPMKRCRAKKKIAGTVK